MAHPLIFTPLILLLTCIHIIGGPQVHAQAGIELALHHSYPPSITKGGIQNSYVSIDESVGVVVANNKGVLWFDGAHWSRLEVPNGTQSRSAQILNSKVYCGGQGFFGSYPLGASSLDANWQDHTARVEEKTGSFEDVWRLFRGPENELVVSTNSFVGSWSDSSGFNPWWKGPVVNAVEWNGGVAVQTNKEIRVFDWTGDEKQRFPFAKSARMEGLVLGSPIALLTHEAGIMHWNEGAWKPAESKLSDRLKSDRLNCMTFSNGTWLIGTSEGGILASTDLETYASAYHVDAGFSSNTVLDMQTDSKGNVWAGLEGGIELIRFSWPHRRPEGLQGQTLTGYTSLHLPTGEIYWGTSQGVLYQPSSAAPPIEVPFLKGPIWSFKSCAGDTWVMHPDGAGILDGSRYTPVVSQLGCWSIVPDPDRNVWYVGTYNGIGVVAHTPQARGINERWRYDGLLEGFEVSTRFLAKRNAEEWWVTHPYRGAYRLRLDPDGHTAQILGNYGVASGLPEPLQVNLCSLQDEALFATQAGVFRYDEPTDRMLPDSSALGQSLNTSSSTQRLYEDPKGGLWIFQGDEISHVSMSGSALLQGMPVGIAPMQMSRPVAPFESIEFTPDERVCVPVENGFIYLDAHTMLPRAGTPPLAIKQIRQLTTSGEPLALNPAKLNLEAGSHAIEFQLKGYDSNWAGIQLYQWRIAELDASWSKPSANAVITLAGLEPGQHTIEFRSLVHDDLVGPVLQVPLTIAPYWHERLSVRLGLAAMAAFLVLMYFKRNQRILATEFALEREAERRKQRDAEVKMEQSIQASEAQLMREREATREKELMAKNQELAAATMNLVQKAQMLQALEAELLDVKTRIPPAETKGIDSMLKTLRDGGKLDEAWDQFAEQFDQVHVEFQQRITDRYPNLTKNDLKLCTYLRMNLSSKEMASLMYVTVRAIEVSRSRLRKRLGLAPGENLLQFIQSI